MPSDQPMKILFADDSATMRKVAEIAFAGDGYDLVTIGGGATIVESVRENQPKVVVLDAEMPDLNGYDACKKLRSEPGINTIPVLLLNGPSSPYDEHRAQDAGVNEHIDKPFETQALYDKIGALATDASASLGPPSASAKPAVAPAREAPRPKVGQKTVLGLGALGSAPPSPTSAKKAPMPPTAGKPKPSPKLGLGAKPAPLSSPIAPKPKPGMKKPFPGTRPQPADGGGLASLSSLGDRSRSAEQRVADLSPEQIDMIKAVAQEVIERVVWEVVPDLAETIIKEQLAKLLEE